MDEATREEEIEMRKLEQRWPAHGFQARLAVPQGTVIPAHLLPKTANGGRNGGVEAPGQAAPTVKGSGILKLRHFPGDSPVSGKLYEAYFEFELDPGPTSMDAETVQPSRRSARLESSKGRPTIQSAPRHIHGVFLCVHDPDPSSAKLVTYPRATSPYDSWLGPSNAPGNHRQQLKESVINSHKPLQISRHSKVLQWKAAWGRSGPDCPTPLPCDAPQTEPEHHRDAPVIAIRHIVPVEQEEGNNDDVAMLDLAVPLDEWVPQAPATPETWEFRINSANGDAVGSGNEQT